MVFVFVRKGKKINEFQTPKTFFSVFNFTDTRVTVFHNYKFHCHGCSHVIHQIYLKINSYRIINNQGQFNKIKDFQQFQSWNFASLVKLIKE